MTDEQLSAHIKALSRKRLATHEYTLANDTVRRLRSELAAAEKRLMQCKNEVGEANRHFASIPHPPVTADE